MRNTELAASAIVCFAAYAFGILALHFMHPEIDPIRQHISKYVTAENGDILQSALLVLGLGTLALATGLWRSLSSSSTTKVELVLLALFGFGIILVMVFPTDAEGAPSTPTGTVHSIAFVFSCLCLIPAQILLSLKFRQDGRWRSFAPYSMAIALLVATAFVAFAATSGTEFTGLTQRIFVATFMAWLIATAFRLRYVARLDRAKRS